MVKSQRKAVYVVFRGRKPGIYKTYREYREQTDGYPKNRLLGFYTLREAEAAWENWQRKTSVELEASVALQNAREAPLRPEQGHAPLAWMEVPDRRVNRINLLESGSLTERSVTGELPMLPILPYPHGPSYEPSPATHQPQRITYLETSFAPPLYSTLITPPHSTIHRLLPDIKRPSSCIDRPEEHGTPPKRVKAKYESELPAVMTATERLELTQPEIHQSPARIKAEDKQIELSPAQQRVVNLALQRKNIFLTGVAGSGKTVTLKEILRQIRKREKGGNVQVIAPT